MHYPPQIALSRLVGKYPRGKHFWSPSYFAGSCGGTPLTVVKDYIENQKHPGLSAAPPSEHSKGIRRRSAPPGPGCSTSRA
ncbi:hypothetical protein GCM10022207_77700 [Streptomyces lannensis]|uniref:Transposase IS200-like domain-containing protein n=1 Tax=Streptomyces lannensis TaxID=766498 RepID=A0ABP7LE29_9ACTN